MYLRVLYRLYLVIGDFRFPIFDKIRSSIVKRLTDTPLDFTVNIFSGVFIEGIDKLKLGNHVSINQDCFISAIGGLTIGNDVSIGHRCSILTTEHLFSDMIVPIKTQPVENLSVRIGNNVWIGANVTVLAGVEIADGVIVGAGSIVTKSIMEYNAIYVGNPARKLKSRFQ
jgi:acetyltransferase-like isoleucine patch superfamily enzyme